MSHCKLARYRRHFVLSVTQKIVSFTSESVRNGIFGRLTRQLWLVPGTTIVASKSSELIVVHVIFK